MDNEKLENLLNLSLNSTPEEREKSQELNTGYNAVTRTWELIVKYNGDLERLESEQIRVEPLIPGYAIVTIQENLIAAFAELEEVEYIEKPKRLFFSVTQAKIVSCFLPVISPPLSLTGQGVIVAVLDSGERVIILST